MLEPRWCVFTPEKQVTPTSCMLILPGRSQVGIHLASAWIEVTDFPNTVFVVITPRAREWYPMPRDSKRQHRAVSGLPKARKTIEGVLDQIQEIYSIPRRRVAIAGFSAGGVMSVNVAAHSEQELAGVVCHAGAILEPHNLPECKEEHKEMPIVLTHNLDDIVFDWEERYLPMVDALEEKGYSFYPLEGEKGGHMITYDDIISSSRIIAPRLGYK